MILKCHGNKRHLPSSRLFRFFCLFIFCVSSFSRSVTAAARSSSSSSTAAPKQNYHYYRILGVEKSVSDTELKKAYRKLALRHHPDKGGSEERFKEIQQAWETLGNPETRKQYDQAGGNANFSDFFQQQRGGNGGDFSQFQNAFGGNSGGVDLESILRQMMSGATNRDQGLEDLFGAFASNGPQQQRRQQQQQPPKPKYYTRPLQCTLEELASGTTKKIKVSVPVSHSHAWIGRQKKMTSRVYKIAIKPGWKAGTKIKYEPKQGFPGMTFMVEELPHPRFIRNDDDLVLGLTITPKQATQGGVLNIVMLDGRTLDVDISQQCPIVNNDTMTIPSMGMPKKSPTQELQQLQRRGNLKIVFRVAKV